MYSIDQGGQPIPVNTVTLQGAAFKFVITPIDVVYAGTLSDDGKSITGSATQHGQTHTMNFSLTTPENAWAIPEPPKPMAPDANPGIEVATVKPSDPNKPGKLFSIHGRHVFTINTTMNDLVTFAYGLHVKQIVGAPDWFATQKYDVDAIPDVEGQPDTKQFKIIFQKVLTERFMLKFHRDKKELAVYAITVSKTGPKLTKSERKPSDPNDFMFHKLGGLRVGNATMVDFAEGMQGAVMDKPVVDQTGLTDRYDFTLDWTPDDSQFSAFGPRPPTPPSDDPNAPPSLYTAMQEQLGLRLEPTKAMADVIVIDHVEKPSEN
jgi:uncharacterized protein (TIGR03435 family)